MSHDGCCALNAMLKNAPALYVCAPRSHVRLSVIAISGASDRHVSGNGWKAQFVPQLKFGNLFAILTGPPCAPVG